uniref:LysR family transcriptional regulator n=1 Tax=Cupriavidus yeoncheonensis TaxID=1462994 RepID=UPI003F494776
MTPRQLKYFLRIAELNSFTKAAAVLHIAQSALSRQIQQLEADLGVQLFVRSDTGVTLTEAGEALASGASRLLEMYAAVRDDVGARAGSPQGQLSIGVPPSLFDLLTVPALLEIRERYPGVSISVIEGISSSIYEQVLSGRLDVGIVLSVESMQGLQHRALFGETLFLVGPPGKLPSTTCISLDMLATLPLLLTQRANAMRSVVETALRSARHSCQCIVEADSTRLQTALVANGAGFSILPYSAIAVEVEAGRLEAAPIDSLAINWTLIHSRERPLGVAAERLLEILLRLAEQLAASDRWPGYLAVSGN